MASQNFLGRSYQAYNMTDSCKPSRKRKLSSTSQSRASSRPMPPHTEYNAVYSQYTESNSPQDTPLNTHPDALLNAHQDTYIYDSDSVDTESSEPELSSLNNMLNEWRKNVKPTFPPESIHTIEEPDITAPSLGLATNEGLLSLFRNNIVFQSMVESKYSTPIWVKELASQMMQPFQTPLSRHLLDVHLSQWEEGRCYGRLATRTWESQLQSIFPFTAEAFYEYYVMCVSTEASDRAWYRYQSTSHRIGLTSDPAIKEKMTQLPSPDYLPAPQPDITIGYNLCWLADTLDWRVSISWQEVYEFTSEGTTFPYLLVNFETGAGGGASAMEYQLQTAGAAALSRSKYVIRGNNAIFCLGVAREVATLWLMWMAGSEKKPTFLLGEPTYFSLSRPDEARAFQNALLNIHTWGLIQRRLELEEEVKAEWKSQQSGATPRGPPSFSVEAKKAERKEAEGKKAGEKLRAGE
ncbi:hypothetical protein F5B19DRAFT_497331 [Rostrohypoxylon terebratum]|nr:hypothetical protein F5B19DRAFT_497331 [Rostrohypoxylon terebratum]